MGHFFPPGPGSGSREPIESGSNPDPGPQNYRISPEAHCILNWVSTAIRIVISVPALLEWGTMLPAFRTMNMSPTCVCVNLHTQKQCFRIHIHWIRIRAFFHEAEYGSGSRSKKDLPAPGETYLQLFKENSQHFKIWNSLIFCYFLVGNFYFPEYTQTQLKPDQNSKHAQTGLCESTSLQNDLAKIEGKLRGWSVHQRD